MTNKLEQIPVEPIVSSAEFRHLQYSSLVSVWTHHNSTRLQWPAIIIGAAFLVIASEGFSGITNIQGWGVMPSLILQSGVPILLAGLGIVVMVYIMNRATKHMTAIENAIDKIEELEGVAYALRFAQLNHQAGFSGPRLMIWFMVFLLAVPLTVLGCLVCFGVIKGLVVWTLGCVLYQVWMRLVERQQTVKKG